MLLSDLFVAGIDGLPAQARVRLAPGVNGVYPAPAELERLLDALFYSQGFDPSAAFVGRDVRAGCVMFDDNNVAYRLMRELGKGTAQLSRAQDGQYAPVTESSADVVSVLRGELRLPSREAFAALFALGQDDLPSRQQKATLAAAAPATAVAAAPLPVAALQAELSSLRAKQAGFGSSREREFELDGLQKKRFALDDLAKKRSQLTERLQLADAALARSQSLEQLPMGFSELVGNFDHVRARFTADRTALLEELRVMEEWGEPKAPEPLFKNTLFLAGLLGGLAFLVGALFVQGDLRLMGLIDIAPFGLAAVQALTFVDALEANERFRARQGRLNDRLKKIEAKFERDTQTVRDAMKRLEVESPDALLAQVTARDGQKAERERLVQALQAFDAGDGQALATGDMAGLDARIMRIEDELAASSMNNEGADVQRRIMELEAVLARGNEPSAAQPVAVAAPVMEPVPFLRLLQALGELTGQPLEALGPVLAEKTSGLAQKALGLAGTLVLDELGHATWQGRSWSTLAMPLQDNVFVAGHLAAFEMIASKVKFPLFLIGLDALPHVLPYSQALQILEDIGVHAQVVMVASDASALLGCGNIVTFA